MTDALTLAVKPALGAYLNTREVQEAKERMRWMYQMSRIDHRARTRAHSRLQDIAQQVRTGRRLDIIAAELLTLAVQIEDVVQPSTGGWPIHYRRRAVA